MNTIIRCAASSLALIGAAADPRRRRARHRDFRRAARLGARPGQRRRRLYYPHHRRNLHDAKGMAVAGRPVHARRRPGRRLHLRRLADRAQLGADGGALFHVSGSVEQGGRLDRRQRREEDDLQQVARRRKGGRGQARHRQPGIQSQELHQRRGADGTRRAAHGYADQGAAHCRSPARRERRNYRYRLGPHALDPAQDQLSGASGKRRTRARGLG